MDKLRILKLHHPTGHPYWQADEYGIELPCGKMFNLNSVPNYKFPEYAWSYINKLKGQCHRIINKPDGIYYQICGASSGGGKTNYKDPFKIINRDLYDKVEVVGIPLIMSNELKDDISENL